MFQPFIKILSSMASWFIILIPKNIFDSFTWVKLISYRISWLILDLIPEARKTNKEVQSREELPRSYDSITNLPFFSESVSVSLLGTERGYVELCGHFVVRMHRLEVLEVLTKKNKN